MENMKRLFGGVEEKKYFWAMNKIIQMLKFLAGLNMMIMLM